MRNYNYYPFGMPMPNRNIQDANGYRYAYQGQEKDPETGKEAFELRLWDSRIGRWLTTDPYGQFFSPYLGMGNNPVRMIDPDGGTCYDAETHQVVDCGDGGISMIHNIDTDPTIGFDEDWDVMVLDEVFIPNKNDWRSAAWQLRQADELANMIARIHEAQKEPAQAIAFTYTLLMGMGMFSAAEVPVSLARPGYYQEGSFSIIDWTGYPKGGVKSTGTYRLLEGEEYALARKSANSANASLRISNPSLYKGLQIHEIKPVKFSGSTTKTINKIALTPRQHAQYTKFWNNLQRNINKKP